MSVRVKHYGNLEYVNYTEAFTADAWYTDFKARHAADIRNHPGNSQGYAPIVPPGTDAVKGRFVFEVHYETATQEAADIIINELEAAIQGTPQVPGTYATCTGASTNGNNNE